ncbi:MAG: hypothetical protein M9894_05390 [Planctomycetes bacterium]|nr:hypothetical protein [Planctomycetota bacterium]
MTAVDRSPAVALVRAARLLAHELVDGSVTRETSREAEARSLADHLLRSELIDEGRTAHDVVQHVLREDGDPLTGLSRLAGQVVQRRNGIPGCAAPDILRVVGREVDTDLLVAAHLAASHAPDMRVERRTPLIKSLEWPSALGCESFLVESLFRRVVVDTHVHLAGALPASFYWLAVMAGFVPEDRYESWSPDPRTWSDAIGEAMDLRQELARLLGVPPSTCPPRWSDGDPDDPPEPFLDPVLEALLPDPRARVRHNPVLGERLVLWGSLALALEPPGREGPSQRLTRYLEVRNAFVRHLTYQAGARGLQRFSRSLRRHHLLLPEWTRGYGRTPEQRRRVQRQVVSIERFRVRHALRYQFSDPTDAPWARDQGRGLEGHTLGCGVRHSAPTDVQGCNGSSGLEGVKPVPRTEWRPPRQIEIRITPRPDRLQARSLFEQLRGVRDFVCHDLDASPIRVGFVFQLRRTARESFREEALHQVDGILHLLDDVPSLRPFVVGVDAASQEQGTPPRELTLAFRRVLEHTRHQPSRPGLPPIRLGRTCHAGEDFKDLLTGLRFVDDAVHLLDLRPGERIGHGLALAIAPAAWYPRRTTTYPRRGDRILDLLWGRHLARLRSPDTGLESDLALDASIQALLEDLLGPCRARERLEAVVVHYECATSEEDVHGYLDTTGRDDPIHVPSTSRHVQLVAALRRRVRARCAAREVIVECCPTSNLLVGAFPDYGDLPYQDLVPLPRTPAQDAPIVPFSINSDDPGLFQTTVENEYLLLAEGLMARGHARRDVVNWLDQARVTGIESSFIPPWSPPTREELVAAIDRLDTETHDGDVFLATIPPSSPSRCPRPDECPFSGGN